MEVQKLTLTEIRAAIKEKKISAREATKACLDEIASKRELNTMITVDEEGALAAAARSDEKIARGEPLGALEGVPIAVKDNISTKGLRTTCGSKMLENYVPPFDATVVERLRAAGSVILGKTNMDEFAMGSTNETSYFGAVKNAVNPTRVPGGSSGGSAAAVAAMQAYATLGSDTGGSIRQPASFCGVVGLKPTYSAVSRYGLIAFASSLDQIGPLARSVRDCAEIMKVIGGYDKRDTTSEKASHDVEYTASAKDLTIGLPKEFFALDIQPEVRQSVLAAVKTLENQGAKVKEVSISSFDAALACYYVLSCAEASSNLSRFDGVKYGYRADGDDYIDVYYNTRTRGFGAEVKRRIMTGNYVLSSGYYDAYYLKASRVRTLIRRDFDAAFSECDVIAGPTSPTTAFEFNKGGNDVTELYAADVFTVPVNIIGNPAISVPCGEDNLGLPIGLQLIGRRFDERTLFAVAETLEKERTL